MTDILTKDDVKIQAFLNEVEIEFVKARQKFPQPNPSLAALTEEVGELAQAMLHIREGKVNYWEDIYKEAVQVATMAARCALEGDPTIGVLPENVRHYKYSSEGF